jgi:F-type H+-transporting ATPase subunit alpha
MEPESLQNVFDGVFDGIGCVLEAFTPKLTPREVGTVTSVATGIVKVSGLPGVCFDEVVTFPGGVLGIAFNVDAGEIGVVLLGEYSRIRAGDEVRRTGRVPEGCRVFSFKQPSADELEHDFLWRTTRRLPEGGQIGIFNRSYYEEVLVVRVHPEILISQGLSASC